MGVERAVTRWYVQRQSILAEIANLEAQLAHIQPRQEGEQNSGENTEQAKTRLSQQIAQAREKLRALGPSPQPMMG